MYEIAESLIVWEKLLLKSALVQLQAVSPASWSGCRWLEQSAGVADVRLCVIRQEGRWGLWGGAGQFCAWLLWQQICGERLPLTSLPGFASTSLVLGSSLVCTPRHTTGLVGTACELLVGASLVTSSTYGERRCELW